MGQRPLLVGLLMLTVSLAGCADNSDTAATQDDVGVDGLDGGTDDVDADAPPILYEAVSLWGDGAGGNVTEMVLYEGTVPIEGNGPTCLRSAVFSYRCATITLDEGVLVPEGTATLRIDGQLSGSQRVGEWHAYPESTHGRNAHTPGGESLQTEGAATDSATWTVELLPVDWDPRFMPKSSFSFRIRLAEPPAVMAGGTVSLAITAIRDPDWVPEPIYDPWPELDPTLMPQQGAFTLGSGVALLESNGDNQGYPYAELEAPRAIPYGTKTVALGVQWNLDCPPEPECFAVARFDNGRSYWTDWPDAESPAQNTQVILLELGAQEPWGPDEEGLNGLWAYAYTSRICYCPYLGSGTAKVLVEAWRADFDMDAFVERLQGVE